MNWYCKYVLYEFFNILLALDLSTALLSAALLSVVEQIKHSNRRKMPDFVLRHPLTQSYQGNAQLHVATRTQQKLQ